MGTKVRWVDFRFPGMWEKPTQKSVPICGLSSQHDARQRVFDFVYHVSVIR